MSIAARGAAAMHDCARLIAFLTLFRLFRDSTTRIFEMAIPSTYPWRLADKRTDRPMNEKTDC